MRVAGADEGESVRARCGVASVSVQLALPALDEGRMGEWLVSQAHGRRRQRRRRCGLHQAVLAAQSLVVVRSLLSLLSRAKRSLGGSLG